MVEYPARRGWTAVPHQENLRRWCSTGGDTSLSEDYKSLVERRFNTLSAPSSPLVAHDQRGMVTGHVTGHAHTRAFSLIAPRSDRKVSPTVPVWSRDPQGPPSYTTVRFLCCVRRCRGCWLTGPPPP